MPVIPAMRPLNAISRTAAMPISAPPASDCSGVNSVIVLVSFLPQEICHPPEIWLGGAQRSPPARALPQKCGAGAGADYKPN